MPDEMSSVGQLQAETIDRAGLNSKVLGVVMMRLVAVAGTSLNARSLIAELCRPELTSFLTFALRILSAHNLWRHLARPRARAC